MNEIENMQNRIVKFCNDRQWKQFHNPKDLAISLVLEATEVMQCFQWKDRQEVDDCLKNDKDHLGDELADTLYWVLLMSHDLDIDLASSFDRKMKQNEDKYPIDKAKGNHKKYTELAK